MWKLIKWLFFLGIIAVIALAITGKKIRGKTVEEHLGPILQSKVVKEGIKDIRSILGEGLKAAGEAITEDVTDEERKQLDDIVRKELSTGQPVQMPPNQQALTPDIKEGATVTGGEGGRPTVREMETMRPEEGADKGQGGIKERQIGDR
jgi:hypothetical protein